MVEIMVVCSKVAEWCLDSRPVRLAKQYNENCHFDRHYEGKALLLGTKRMGNLPFPTFRFMDLASSGNRTE